MDYRYGITIPFDAPLHQQRDQIAELQDLGYNDLWSAEADGTDGFTPLVLASQWAPELRLGIAIIPAYTRGPALLAQTVASICEAAPGRFVMGIGSSSDVIVERWNGVPFNEPFKQTRDMVRFMQKAFTGEKVTEDYVNVSVKGFTLRRKPDPAPPILVAALRPGMLRMAGKVADGAIINWLAPHDVKTVAPIVREENPDAEIVARIFVCPSTDTDTVRAQARRVIAAYMNVEVYAKFHEWLGRGEEMAGMWSNWKAGDRKAALEAIPDSVVDDLIVHGSPEQCRDRIQQYHDNGVTTSAIAILPFAGIDVMEAARQLSPSAR